ncbi:MAG: tyrosine--tRNA ligase [bacterium]|nr:tyrosine--tRNA ligase [bacterium]
MKLSEELKWRGFWNQTTFTDESVIDNTNFTLYLGTDPSADSLHVGHLAVYMMVRRFLDRGHKVVLLVGGGTGVIGDMRDTEERELLALEEISKNTLALSNQVSKLFSSKDFTLVNNHDWLKDLQLLPFLRDVGKKFNMAELTSRDFFKSRIKNGGGLSFAEFSYTLLQGYDFLHLNRNLGVNLQIGGSDQWGNLLSGVELIRKSDGKEVYAMTAPLVVNKSTGRKFGKSEGGAVWLDESKTSAYKFYQFWLNSDDAGAIDYLKLFTTLSKEEIEDIQARHTAEPHLRIAQKTLAHEVTTLIHGADRALEVEKATEILFGRGDFEQISPEVIEILTQEIPVASDTQSVISALTSTNTAKSAGEARRLISGNAISVNGIKITEDQQIATTSLIKKGKNTFVLVKI